MLHQFTTDMYAMMMVPHHKRHYMDNDRVANWPNLDRKCSTMCQNDCEQNLISDSELVYFFEMHTYNEAFIGIGRIM